MRIRLGFSPCSILSHTKCTCSSPSKSVPLTFSHVVNCNKMITHRSIIHNNVRDCLWSMFCSYRIEAKIEPVLEHLNCFRSNRSARGDLYTAWINSHESICDITTIDPLNTSNLMKKFDCSEQPLENAEIAKRKKYEVRIDKLNSSDRASPITFIPLAVSIYGRLSVVSLIVLRCW
ncbi:hypothetical protein RCL1_003234 [Eukaryota sp. TZLM3-RCL]